jgi:N-methylhydantoinase A
MERKARAELRRDGFEEKAAQVEQRLDVRYRGQSYELTVPYTPRFVPGFHRAHERAYGYCDPARPLEIVNLRLRLVIPTPKLQVRRQRLRANPTPRGVLVKTKPVWFERRPVTTPFYDRIRLPDGVTLRGPAVIAEYSSTTVIPPGFVCRVDEYLNLVLTCDEN